MNTSKHKKIGITLATLAVVILAAFKLAGVPLISHITKVISSSQGATMTDSTIHFHWSLFPTVILFLAGVVLFVMPRRENAA